MPESRTKHVAIIGTGLSGLSCAHSLLAKGIQVHLFEKGAHAGGRLATEFFEHEGVQLYFDNGAQYFTVRDAVFKTQVDNWIQKGLVAQWQGVIGKVFEGELQNERNSHERFVGTPNMRTVANDLAQGLKIDFSTGVQSVCQKGEKWILKLATGTQTIEYDAVVLALPPSQAVPLLKEFPTLSARCSSISMNPCWATSVSFSAALPLHFDGIFGDAKAALSWVCRDSSKPQRLPGERWVLHASNSWTRKHLEDNPEVIGSQLLKEFFEMVKIKPVAPQFIHSHLWHDAAPALTDAVYNLSDMSGKLQLCGDWSHSSKVEGAFMSGQEAARKIGDIWL